MDWCRLACPWNLEAVDILKNVKVIVYLRKFDTLLHCLKVVVCTLYLDICCHLSERARNRSSAKSFREDLVRLRESQVKV